MRISAVLEEDVEPTGEGGGPPQASGKVDYQGACGAERTGVRSGTACGHRAAAWRRRRNVRPSSRCRDCPVDGRGEVVAGKSSSYSAARASRAGLRGWCGGQQAANTARTVLPPLWSTVTTNRLASNRTIARPRPLSPAVDKGISLGRRGLSSWTSTVSRPRLSCSRIRQELWACRMALVTNSDTISRASSTWFCATVGVRGVVRNVVISRRAQRADSSSSGRAYSTRAERRRARK